MFRVYLSLRQDTLSKWKDSHPEYFILVKESEDKILGIIEGLVLWGSSHPALADSKFNAVGGIFILKAYDKELYVPEMDEGFNNKEKIILEIKNYGQNQLS